MTQYIQLLNAVTALLIALAQLLTAIRKRQAK